MKFFNHIGSFFKKAFSKAPAWQQTASATITVVAPLIETVLAFSGNEEAASECARIVSEVQSDLAAASAMIAHGAPVSSLNGVLAAVDANLGTLLSAGHIKNPETLAKVSAIVKTISSELQAVASIVPKA